MGQMEEFGESSTKPVKDSTEAVENMGTAAQKASTPMGDFATKTDAAAQASGNLGTNLEGVPEDMQAIADIDGTRLDPLVNNLQAIAGVLGGEDGTGGLIGALQQLTGDSIDITPLTEQFLGLQAAIEGVTTALGGAAEAPATNGGMGGTGAQSKGNMGQMTGGEEGGGSGLTGAIEAVKTAADTYIGTGAGEGESEGGGTAISDFEALGSAVNDVSAAIGSGGSEGEAKSSTGDGKKAVTFSSKGWAGGAIKKLNESLSVAGFDVLEDDSLDIKFAPNDDELDLAYDLGKKLAQIVKD